MTILRYKKHKTPKLCVLGAGPGDPELLTIKGYKALQQADVILYDNLANKELLSIAASSCENIFVGKKPYGNSISQDQIHELIKHYAFSKGNVIRLKGGDPFIFGRGFEELLFARNHGIETQYIPGISSMQATGFSDIPLTHRGISESIWAITGTKKDGSLSEDLQLAMKSKATVVIYMGMSRLHEIVKTYIEAGMGSTPAAIIQHASMPHQRKVICEVKELQQNALKSGLSHPAIIIIGKVVSISESGTTAESHFNSLLFQHTLNYQQAI